MGAEGLRHLDDHGCLRPARPHHYHLSGSTVYSGLALKCGMNEILFCFHGGCIWQALFDYPWGTVVGVM